MFRGTDLSLPEHAKPKTMNHVLSAVRTEDLLRRGTRTAVMKCMETGGRGLRPLRM